jgi:hypothetical protein
LHLLVEHHGGQEARSVAQDHGEELAGHYLLKLRKQSGLYHLVEKGQRILKSAALDGGC